MKVIVYHVGTFCNSAPKVKELDIDEIEENKNPEDA